MGHAIDIEPHQRLSFAMEQFVLLPVVDRVNVQNFNRHIDAIAQAFGMVNLALASAPELLDDAILPVGFCTSQAHRRII